MGREGGGVRRRRDGVGEERKGRGKKGGEERVGEYRHFFLYTLSTGYYVHCI